MVVLVVKSLAVSAGDTRDGVPSLAWEDPLEQGMAIHSSILAWRVGRVAIYSLDALLSQFGASPLFHVQF